MALDFPASPSVGQIYQGWIWNGVSWDLLVSTPGIIAVRAFTSAQTYQPSSSAVQTVLFEGVGGGCGGCATSVVAGYISAGAGGGAGAYARKLLTAAQAAGLPIVIGAGGLGNPGGASPPNFMMGSPGGDTSVGTLLVAKGAPNAGATVNVSGMIQPGPGGPVAGSVGDFVAPGGSGACGFQQLPAAMGGSSGGNSHLGAGAPGPAPPTAAGVGVVGNNATGYGGGGSGAMAYGASPTNYAGGNGMQGVVLATEYAATQPNTSLPANPIQSGAKVLLATQTVSAPVATVDFLSSVNWTLYDEYEIHINGLTVSATSFLQALFSEDGATWLTAANSYAYGGVYATSSATVAGFGATAAYMQLSVGHDPVAGYTMSAHFTVAALSANATLQKWLWGTSSCRNSSNGMVNSQVSAAPFVLTPVQGLRFLMSTGNITGGIFKVYGIAK